MTATFARRGAVVVLAAAAMLAGDAAVPRAQAPSGAAPPALIALVNAARRDIDRFWAARVQNYRPPVDVVMVQAPTRTDCGAVEDANAFYCSATHKIYWELSLFRDQFQLGDFAPVFILAHEWGHLVQLQMPNPPSLLAIQQELQADCLAGFYAHDALQRRVLDPGDDDEAVLSLRRAGDKLDSPWFNAQAHGSPGLRIDAFTYGYEGRVCNDDAFWAFLRQRGVDPSRAPQAPAPTQGRAEDLMPRTNGRFGRFVMVDLTRVRPQGSVDGVKARYRLVNAAEWDVEAVAIVYPTPDAARNQVEAEVRAIIARGATEIRRSRLVDKSNPGTQLGVQVVLRRTLDYVVWSNGHVLGIIEAPASMIDDFFTGLPF